MIMASFKRIGLALAMGLAAISLPLINAPAAKASDHAEAAPVAPFNLLTERRESPQDVGRTQPRLSWHSPVDSQAAFEIEVASTKEDILAGVPDLWSSGWVRDGRSVAIAYTGLPLTSRQSAVWRVRIWEEGERNPGPWSEFAAFKMGLLENDDWQARWITSPMFPAAETTPGLEKWLELTAADPQFRDSETVADTIEKLRDVRPATYFRKDFTIKGPVKSATLYSTSAGYSEFYLSGEKIGDRILNPAQTDFDKRIYYDVDDLTSRLAPGKHTLAIHLGNGFYGERTAFGLARLFFGEPAAIAQLEIEYADGTRETIVSDETWQARPSPILKNGVYSGEVYDARERAASWNAPAGMTKARWVPAAVLDQSPTQQLIAAEIPPVRRVTEVTPQAVLSPADGVWTIDFGQNFTGVPTIDMSKLGLTSGQTVLFRFAEWASEDGLVGMNSGGGAPRTKQVDAYVSDGVDALPWSPAFTWHGFRYMEVTGIDGPPPLDAITAHLTRTDLRRIGEFESSSPLLDRIHETAMWTLESNLVSVLSDCPIRERNGWTGDALAIARMASYNLDFAPFLERFLGDFRTASVPAPSIVPGRRVRPGMIDWASAEIILAWEHYLHSGDTSPLTIQYDSMAEYLAYVEEVADGDQLINPNHYYGDWCDMLPTPGMTRPDGACRGFNTKGELTANALISHAYTLMTQIAVELGNDADAARYGGRRDAFRAAFHAAYFDKALGHYGSQTANAMAISFDIVPAELADGVAAAINSDILENWGGHASVGALGQPWVYPVLSDNGYTDTAFGIFNAEGYPGYKYLFDTLNATSLWEDVSNHVPERKAPPGKSLSHPFKGGYGTWFYSGLGGIKPDEDNPGFKHFFLEPVFPTDLEHATIGLDTPYGMIRSAWKRVGAEIHWDVEVPFNTRASVNLGDDEKAQHSLTSGRYSFVLSGAGDRIVSMMQQDD